MSLLSKVGDNDNYLRESLTTMKDDVKVTTTSINIVNELRCSNSQLQERVAKLEDLLEKQKRSYGELQTQGETLQAQCARAQSERDESFTALHSAEQESQEQIQKARNEVDSLKKELEEARADADCLRQLKQQFEERDQLKSNVGPPRGIMVKMATDFFGLV